jgi:hypothetical protein
MKLFTFLAICITLSSCGTMERAKQDRVKLENGLVGFGQVKLHCEIAGSQAIPVRSESYTELKDVVTGSKKIGAGHHC